MYFVWYFQVGYALYSILLSFLVKYGNWRVSYSGAFWILFSQISWCDLKFASNHSPFCFLSLSLFFADSFDNSPGSFSSENSLFNHLLFLQYNILSKKGRYSLTIFTFTSNIFISVIRLLCIVSHQVVVLHYVLSFLAFNNASHCYTIIFNF